MESIWRIGICIALAVQSAGSQAGAPFSLTLGAPPSPIKVGQRFALSILVSNTSTKRIVLSRVNHGEDVGIVDYTPLIGFKAAPDSIVQNVAVIPYRSASEGRFSAQQAFLEPGENFTDKLFIANRFDFSRPGQYFIRLRRSVPDPLGGGEAISNQVEVDVVE